CSPAARSPSGRLPGDAAPPGSSLLLIGDPQLWHWSGVRGVIFFSAAYLAAAAFTIGLITASSAWYQSELNCHLVPSQVWMRAQAGPMWSAQLVETGRITSP